MNIKYIALTVLMLSVVIESPSQNITNRLNNFNQKEYTSYTVSNSKADASTIAEIDRAMRPNYFQQADSPGIIVVDDELHVRKTPAIFWGLGAGALYLGGNYILYGGLDNIGIIGLVGYPIVGILIGTIANQAKREHILNKRRVTKLKEL